MLHYKLTTPFSTLYLSATENGICGLTSTKPTGDFASSLTGNSSEVKFLKQAEKELTEYFSGKRKSFDVALDLEGSDFQKKVWKQLQKISFGKTCAYKDIATKLNDPNASRAVGSANGKNPIWIIIPCHRVITASGALGGYAGGLSMKKKLLELEAK